MAAGRKGRRKKSVFAPASLSVLQAAPEMSHNVISIGLSGDF